MSKVTSKLQLTLPKALADKHRIKPGDEVDWQEAGDAIRLVPRARLATALDVAARLKLFDEATARQKRREKAGPPRGRADGRGWTREELYGRGRAR